MSDLQHSKDLADEAFDREIRAWAESRIGSIKRLHDTSPEAEADWKAESAADAFQESGGLYREGLANLRRDCPWLFDHSIPEPHDRDLEGYDPRLFGWREDEAREQALYPKDTPARFEATG